GASANSLAAASFAASPLRTRLSCSASTASRNAGFCAIAFQASIVSPYFSHSLWSLTNRSRLREASLTKAPPTSDVSGTTTPRKTTQSSSDDLVTLVSVCLGLAMGSSSQDCRTAYHALGRQLNAIAVSMKHRSRAC